MRIVTAESLQERRAVDKGRELVDQVRHLLVQVELRGREPAIIVVSHDEKCAIRAYVLDEVKRNGSGIGPAARRTVTHALSIDGYPVLSEDEWSSPLWRIP